MKIKADENEELDLAFSEQTAKITSVEDVHSKDFGDKVTLSLTNEKLGDFCIFVNNLSMKALVEAYGNNDEAWIGKTVSLSKQKDEKFKTEMIVVKAHK